MSGPIPKVRWRVTLVDPNNPEAEPLYETVRAETRAGAEAEAERLHPGLEAERCAIDGMGR